MKYCNSCAQPIMNMPNLQQEISMEQFKELLHELVVTDHLCANRLKEIQVEQEKLENGDYHVASRSSFLQLTNRISSLQEEYKKYKQESLDLQNKILAAYDVVVQKIGA